MRIVCFLMLVVSQVFIFAQPYWVERAESFDFNVIDCMQNSNVLDVNHNLFMIRGGSIVNSKDGVTWLTTEFPTIGEIRFLNADNNGVIFVACNSGVYFSQDQGLTWKLSLEGHDIANLFKHPAGHMVAVTVENKIFEALPEPGSQVEFVTLNPTNSKKSAKWSPVLTDIVNHEKDDNNYDDLVTLAHETSHGIHAWIRNNMNNTGKRANAFYVLQNRAVLVIEPKIRKSQVAPYVPKSLRESRYDMYIVGQTSWDDTPLYIWDEWNAYANGGDTGVDLVQNNLWKAGWRDAVMGEIEFVVYALASGMAVKDLDPQYFASNTQFKEFMAWNIKRSMQSFKLGMKMEQFKWDKQDKYYENFKTSPDAAALRKFTVELFGAEWTKDVIGF